MEIEKGAIIAGKSIDNEKNSKIRYYSGWRICRKRGVAWKPKSDSFYR
jgi:hypothetical protein